MHPCSRMIEEKTITALLAKVIFSKRQISRSWVFLLLSSRASVFPVDEFYAIVSTSKKELHILVSTTLKIELMTTPQFLGKSLWECDIVVRQ